MKRLASRIETLYSQYRHGLAIAAGTLLLLALFGVHWSLHFTDGLRILYVLPVWLATRLGGRWAGAALVGLTTILGPFIDEMGNAYQVDNIPASVILWAVPLAIVMLVIARVEEGLWSWRRRAMYDPLTGLLNRAALKDFAEDALTRATYTQEPLVVVLIDCDDFKMVNDRHGHQAGDRVLQILAKVLENETRESDLVARTGGDEFVVIFPNTTEEEARRVMGRVERMFDSRMIDAGYATSLSVGLARLPLDDDPSVEDLMKRADEDMYRRKGDKKRRVYLN